MRKLLVDCRLPRIYRDALAALGYEAVGLPPFAAIAPPVASHPDMLVYPLNPELLVHADYYAANKALFDRLGRPVITTDEHIAAEYPADILLNALDLGDAVYGRLDCVSKHILSAAAETVGVRQGYARCSVCVVGTDAVITADPSIAAAAKARGADTLVISPGGVRLGGYSHGFIGGACCALDAPGGANGALFPREKRLICFFGALESHPDCAAIKRFAENHGAAVVSLSCAPLYDYGGAVEV